MYKALVCRTSVKSWYHLLYTNCMVLFLSNLPNGYTFQCQLTLQLLPDQTHCALQMFSNDTNCGSFWLFNYDGSISS